jgi:DNA-binding NarL/FixJ family response regulator
VKGVSSRLRVLIAEDQYLTREGTRRLLEERGELEVVGVASDFDSVCEPEGRTRRARRSSNS